MVFVTTVNCRATIRGITIGARDPYRREEQVILQIVIKVLVFI